METRLLSLLLGLTGFLLLVCVCHPVVVAQFLVASAVSYAVLWVFRVD